MGFLSVPNLVPWLIFSVNILGVRVWILLDQTPVELEMEGIKEREDGEKVWSERLFEGVNIIIFYISN